MLVKMCSIYDGKAEAWTNPMYFRSNGEAVRSFQDAANNKELDVGRHPEDYALFEVGEFDPRTGEVRPLVPPLHLATGVNLVAGLEVVQ